MSVLVLLLSGPLQSWGDASRFSRRSTRHEPTKSGVVGLLASALGRTREESVDDLAQLELAVRVDQRGGVMRDFQTAHPEGKSALPISSRYYLSDAKFAVALGGPEALVAELASAVQHPCWPLYLGRRSCPPDRPIFVRVDCESDDPRTVLANEPWHAAEHYRRFHGADRLEMVCDGRDGESCESQADVPLSFSLTGRRYACRPVTRYTIVIPGGAELPHSDESVDQDDVRSHAGFAPPADHNPLSVL